MRGRSHSFQRLAAVLVIALVAPAGLVAAGHAWYNGTYYCGLNATAGGAAGAATVAEGSSVSHRVTYCQRYTGWTTAASYLGGSRVAGPGTIHLNAGQTGTIALSFNAGGPGDKELYAYIVASFATPGPSLYNGYDHIDLRVVGNPSTPSVGEDHNPDTWSQHNHPHWTWSSSASHGSIAQYHVDTTWQGSFTTGATDYHPTLGSGDHAVRVRAQNNVGVWSGWSGWVHAKVDTTPPSTSLSLAGTPGNAGWWRSAVTATLSASDAHSGVASTSKALDGAAFSGYAGPFGIAGEGAHTLRYFSTDNVGNVEAARSSGLSIDTVAPGTAISVGAPSLAQGGTTYLTSAARVTLTASDATSGVASTTFNLGGGAQGYAGPFALTGQDGPRTLTASSVDVAGNAEGTQTKPLFLDNTPPLSQLAAGQPSAPDAAGTYVKSTTPISVGATDGGVGVGASYHRVAGGAWEEGSPFTLPAQDGRYAVEAYAQDRLGNTEAPPKAAAFQVDDTPPALALTTPAPDTLYALGASVPLPLPDCGAAIPCTAPVLDREARPAVVLGGSIVGLAAQAADPAVNGVASGMAAVRYALDGQPLGEATAPPWGLAWDTRSVPGGLHKLTATALDRLGNAASEERSVLVVPATPEGLAATPAYLAAQAQLPAPGPVAPPTLPPVQPPGPVQPPQPPPAGVPDAPSVKPVFSAIVDPNARSLYYKVGLEVNGQFVGDERTIDL